VGDELPWRRFGDLNRADNPLIRLRRTLGIGQAQFARALGVSLPALWAAENGTTAQPTGIFRALHMLGYDSPELPRAYARWRARLLEGERHRLRDNFTAASFEDSD
jgi:transcriptional regulator with XRE-family HTH domain